MFMCWLLVISFQTSEGHPNNLSVAMDRQWLEDVDTRARHEEYTDSKSQIVKEVLQYGKRHDTETTFVRGSVGASVGKQGTKSGHAK